MITITPQMPGSTPRVRPFAQSQAAQAQGSHRSMQPGYTPDPMKLAAHTGLTPEQEFDPVVPSGLLDGLTLLPSVRYLPDRWDVEALIELAPLRASSAWTPKWYCAPQGLPTIPARGYSQTQLRMAPYSLIWAIRLASLTGGVAESQWGLDLSDPCSRLRLISTPVLGRYRPATTDPMQQVLINPTFWVSGEGLLDLTLNNNSDTDAQVQLILYTLEPVAPVGV